MTPVMDSMIEAGARAMGRSRAWPTVFAAGSAAILASACIRAAMPGLVEELLRAIPGGQIGDPQDVANAIRARADEIMERSK